MRNGWKKARTELSVIKILTAINGLIFLVGLIPIDEGIPLESLFYYYGARWPVTSPGFYPWQLLTSIFLHNGFRHIIFNMLGLYWFGTELEDVWGWKKFLLFYLICGIGANVIDSIVLDFIIKEEEYYALGASGAIFGVLTAYALLFPRRQIYMMFFVPMPARTAVIVYALFEIYAGVTRMDNGGHFAHLGGALIGLLMVRIGRRAYSRFQFTRPTHPGDPPPGENGRKEKEEPASTTPSPPKSSPAPFTMEHNGSTIEVSREQLDELLDRLQMGRARYADLSDLEKAIVSEAAKRTVRSPVPG